MRNFKLKLYFIGLTFLLSCKATKNQVYIDDWQGKYDLVEHNSCCNEIKKVKLFVYKIHADSYQWKLFNEVNKDTLAGTALYLKNKLSSYVDDVKIAQIFFNKKIVKKNPVFYMEYNNYHTDSLYKYVGYYTRWNNELKEYKSHYSFAASTSYHFKIPGKKEFLLPK